MSNKVIDYVMNSPQNTNPNVLKGLLESSEQESSDFSTAEVTITNNTESDIRIALPVISGHGDFMFGTIDIASQEISTPHLIALYKGKTIGGFITDNVPSAVCTGGVTTMGLRITITGNGTITFGTASEG